MKKNKMNLSDFCFNLAWFIYIFRTATPRICDKLPFINYLLFIQFIALFICIILKKYNKKQWLIILLLESALIFLYNISRNYQMLTLFNFILAFKGYDFKKVAKYDIFLKMICLILNFLAMAFNVIDFTYSIRNGRPRYDFGFYNPNTFASICMSIVVEIIFLKSLQQHSSKKLFIFPILIGLILNYYCQSRGSALILIMLGIGLLFQNFKIFSRLLKYLPTLLTIMSWYVLKLYTIGNSFAIKLDSLLSTRLFCASNYLKVYKLNLFGNNIINYDKWIGFVQTIDIGYIHLPLTNGLILYLIFLIFYSALLNKISKSKNKCLIVIMFVFCLFGLIEKTALLLSCNIFLLIMSDIIFFRKELEYEDFNYNTNV